MTGEEAARVERMLDRRSELAAGPGAWLERMVEIRLLEDRIVELFYEGRVAGTTHTCQGQEAVAVGLAAVLRPTDTVACTYRGHGHALALGALPEAVLGEVLGRQVGSVGGVGGSMHLCEPAIGLLPTFAIIGAGIPVAVGAALAAQLKGSDDVAVAVFGDGATNIGAFHEGLNLASIWRLPVVFVVENNLYGEYSRIDRTTPIEHLADRAGAYGMAGVIVDGQHVNEVVGALSSAVGAARAGEGPSLLEMKTYRYAGHSRSDKAEYRPAGELETWQERDPIRLLRSELESSGVLESDGFDRILGERRLALREAEAVVESSPLPPIEAILRA